MLCPYHIIIMIIIIKRTKRNVGGDGYVYGVDVLHSLL